MEFKQGEIWALVGDSNSGNSNLLAQFNGPNAELVAFRHNFRTLANTTDFYYQQRFNSFDSEDSPTVQEHLATITTTHVHWQSHQVISMLNLSELLDEQVIKLSNGETKRVLLAAALLRNPSLLLLDHPLTGLDTDIRETFNLLLANIASAGVAIAIATDAEDLPEAVKYVAIVEDGQVVRSVDRLTFNRIHSRSNPDIPLNTELLNLLLAGYQPQNYSTVIGMNNVTIKYDDKKILDNVSWHVRSGERWALTGPNGAGKSTLLSLVNGDNPQAYSNDITLFDRKRGTGESIWDIKKKTGFVSPELYQYFPTDSSCLHVIESGFYDTVGLFRPTDPPKEEIAIRWMELFNVQQHAHHLFNRIPPAVQRLALLARALVKNPPLLILDEPTQGLDNRQQRFFTRLINEICMRTTVTLVYVSHYQHHIPTAVNKSLRLRGGRVAD